MSLRYLPVLGNSVAKASRTLFPCFESLHLQPGYHGSRSILCRNFHPLRRKFGSERQNTAFQSFGSRPWPWWHLIRSFWFQVQVWPVFYAEEVIPAALFWTFVIFISFILPFAGARGNTEILPNILIWIVYIWQFSMEKNIFEQRFHRITINNVRSDAGKQRPKEMSE